MDEFDKIKAFSKNISEEEEGNSLLDKGNPAEDDSDLYTEDSPFEDRPFTPTEQKHSLRLHFIALGIFIFVLLISLITLLFFSSSEDTQEVAVIEADSAPVKVIPTPDEQGGMEIPNQDKLVYNRIRTETVDTKVESLFPEPEQPLPPEIEALEKNAPDVDFVPMDSVKTVNPLDTKSLSENGVVSGQKPVIVQEATAPKTEALPLSEMQKTDPLMNKGAWSTQLMSSPKKEVIEKSWKTILAKNKSILAGVSHEIASVSLPGKGTFYRLRVGSFKNRDEAVSFCSKLKANKQDCIPAKND